MGLFLWSCDGGLVLMIGSDGGGDAGGDGLNGWVEDDGWREAVVISGGIGGSAWTKADGGRDVRIQKMRCR